MIVTNTDNISIITRESASIVDIAQDLTQKYVTFEQNHIIVNLLSILDLENKMLDDFLTISKRHKENSKSFVIVCSRIDIDELPEELTVTPTLQEAYDIIEMEDIERDLGF